MPKGFIKKNVLVNGSYVSTWVELKKLYVKKNGAWTNLAAAYVKKNVLVSGSYVSQWVKVFAAAGPTLNSSPVLTAGDNGKLFSTYTTTNGSWDGAGLTLTYTRQWVRADAVGGPYTNISGATATTYVTVAADDGKYITVTVRATDTNGLFAEATATPVKIVRHAPVNLTKSITGTATDGETLTATHTWTATTDNANDTKPDSYTYLWMYENGTAATNTNTNSTYILDADDVGEKLKVKITATNSGGSTEVTTAVTAAVTAGLGAFTVNTVTKTDGTADDTVTLDNPTYDATNKEITVSFSGSTVYEVSEWGAAFNPDGSESSPSSTPTRTLGTSLVIPYSDSGTANIGLKGSSPAAKATVSWTSSTNANAYVVTYKVGTSPFNSDSGYILSGTSFSLTMLDGLKFTLISVTAYENANGTGLTKTGTLPTDTANLEVTPTQTFGTITKKSVDIPVPFVAPTFGGSNPSWTGAANFQRTTQTTPTTGRRITSGASGNAYIYHSGKNNLAVGASVTIGGLGTPYNGTYTIAAIGSDTNGNFIRYSRPNQTSSAYTAIATGTISATSGLRWGWNNGTRTWLGSVKSTNYGWWYEVAVNSGDGYGSWAYGWKKFSSTNSTVLVNNTAFRYVINSNTTETGEVNGSTEARYGRVQAYAEGTDGNLYYHDTGFTSYI